MCVHAISAASGALPCSHVPSCWTYLFQQHNFGPIYPQIGKTVFRGPETPKLRPWIPPIYIYIFAVNSIALRVTFLGLLVGSAEHRPNTPSSAPPWLHARGPPNRPVESSEVWNDQKCSKNVPVAHLRVARVFEVRGARSFWGDRSRSRGARQEPCSEEQGECRHHKERGICAAATRLGGV